MDPAAAVELTFNREIRALEMDKVFINDSAGEKVRDVKAAIDGRVLVITHGMLKDKTTYTVYVPAGVVGSKSSSAKNRAINWSFTTKALEAKPGVPPVSGEGVPGSQVSCTFSDLPAAHWAFGVIREICQKNIISGYPGGTFGPEKSITRAEFTKIIAGAAGLKEVKPAKPTFTDVRPGDWHYGYIEAAAGAGLVTGLETGDFLPNDRITREQLAVILVRGLQREEAALALAGAKTEFADDLEIAPWAKGYVVEAVREGLVSGYPDNTFGPKNSATRAEACAMISRYLRK
ncbi:MAG: Endoglucanase precursor [Firmicutes bacterium ADurb.Bin456]|nr:MAG: Endoglucanase precursor [Firmicutes bacterium ADurb.Bin456]